MTGKHLTQSAKVRFERMVKTYARDMYRYALALSRNPSMAEDVVQETFLRAWRRLETLRDPTKAKSWLFTTLRREYFRQFERYHPEFVDLDIDAINTEENSADEDRDIMERAIWSLPQNHRDVLAFQVIGGYTGREIGEMMRLPRATINTRLFRARQSLKRVLEEPQVPVKTRHAGPKT
jgi:RNA polymerase sigma-70 factor (ECF subfamily)